MRVGLVLSGGGAKGAYQAGVVESLAVHGIEIAMVSGASIGALNGAIVSSSEDIATAASRLNEVWQLVASEDILKVNFPSYPRYLAMLAGAGLVGPGRAGLALLASWSGNHLDQGLLDTAPLTKILNRYLAHDALAKGKPLHVALYPYRGRLHALTELIKGEIIQRIDTQHSVFKHIQSLKPEEQREALLASAAIPVLFTPREVQGQRYSDGGQGNYKAVQGNTPVTPMLGQGLDVIIVSHLSDGSLWNVDAFPGENIFELRPSAPVSEDGMRDMLGFDQSKIRHWQQQGKSDTDRLLGELDRFAGARARLAGSEIALRNQLNQAGGTLERPSLESAMRRLRGD